MSEMPIPTLASRVRIKPDVLFQDLDGEAVLLDLASGTYFGLNAVGTRIWELLPDHELLSSIADIIVGEYAVAAERCASDLLGLVGELQVRGLVNVN
jgi:hypothetical protein